MQINSDLVSHLLSRKNDRQSTSFTTQFTTTSPQKTIRYTALFPKHPSKMPVKQQNPGAN
jgi:hypothetical protein